MNCGRTVEFSSNENGPVARRLALPGKKLEILQEKITLKSTR